MSQHLYILTGGSRGMGLAIAEQLLQNGHTLICISRNTQSSLTDLAHKKGATLEQWSHDLADGASASIALKNWLQAHSSDEFQSATLINNAGVIGHLGPLTPQNAELLQSTLAINLEAPMQLSAAFLTATRTWGVPKKIVNISSGLGRRAMAGSSMYCASKAGLDHFSRCVALEEASLTNGARIVSLAPGVIDTDMQTDLRSGNPAGFPDQANFIQLKQSGSLTSPAEAAARVLGFLARRDFGSNVVADVRD